MRRPRLTLVAVCSGWGTIPLLVRHVDLPAQAIVFSRLAIAAVGLGAALAWERRTGRRTGPPVGSWRPVLCVLTAAVLAFHWVSLFAAYQRAPSSTVILIVYLAPVGIAALSPRFLGERHSRRTLIALALGAAGFGLVVGPALRSSDAAVTTAGLVLAGLAGCSFVALVLLSKPLAEAYGGLRTAFIEMAGASVLLLPVAALTGWGPPRPTWAWLVVLGLVHTALGTGLYLGALARVPATAVGILGYLEPAAVVLLGWLFLHESPAPATLAGGILIVLAGWLTVTEVPLARR
ncbi:MAG: hypothetical protein QOK43_36 [Acidimicrobiaceae bacterium]|jgi:drug/metabolite transporter (DMT)-like permease|nr:hypothetical protein [Acidimicrobiaceae bacterium]MDQ1444022.1 hypothetical protein [Acidimicrobiaceae bacterium]